MLPNGRLRSYHTVAVTTASPGKLILMLFDGALRFLHAAEEGFKLTSHRERVEAVHNNLLKAQNIIHELQSSLNTRDGGDFANNLFRLYDFMKVRLSDANVRKEPENIRIVVPLLVEIRDAWAQMLRQQTTTTANLPEDAVLRA